MKIQRVLIMTLVLLGGAAGWAENVDPYHQGEAFGWSENAGWLNFEPAVGGGMQMNDGAVTGWVWSENIGWINLSCENNNTCGTVPFGVTNTNGRLSGFAWGENVGWINFDPVVPGESRLNEYCVRVDDNGLLDGWAWGENIGWIHFEKSEVWSVRVCIVTLEDLTNFASHWLAIGTSPANLDNLGRVDMIDYSIFAEYWQDYCPDGWLLKD